MTTPTSKNIIDQMLENDLDLLGHQVINTHGQERVDYWKAFQKLYAIFPRKNVEYGRVYNRRTMCQVAVSLTVATEMEQDATKDFGMDNVRPLSQWKEKHWDNLNDSICMIANNMLRKDADACLADEDEENEAPDSERGRSGLYSGGLEGLLRSIKIQRALSPFREWLKDLTENEETDDAVKPNLDENHLKQFTELVRNEQDKHVKSSLRKLLDGSNELRGVGVLREVLTNSPYDLLKIHKKFCRGFICWTEDVFETPVLNQIVFPQHEDDVGRLRRTRLVLGAEGFDPLEESLALAEGLAGAKRSPASINPERASSRYSPSPKRPRRLTPGKKKSATRLKFTEDDEDDDEELSETDDNHNASLSELPRRRAIRVGSPRSPMLSPNKISQKKKYAGRRRWTDEEKTAIKEGMRQLGKGKWADIKETYKVILNDRTSGQIKDCHRTMLRRGELGDAAPDYSA